MKDLKTYAVEWDLNNDEVKQIREPLPDWGFVVYRKSKYFIMYCL